MKEIFIILSHPSNNEQKKFLRDICNTLKENSKDFLVAAHVPIPTDIVDIATITYYNKHNKLLYDQIYKGYLFLEYPTFAVGSKNFFSYNSTLAVYELMMPSFVLAKMAGYNIAHFIEYDSKIENFTEFEKNSKILTEENIDIVIYNKDDKPGQFFMSGEFNSWNLDKFNLDYFYFTEDYIKNHIRNFPVGEGSTFNLLIQKRNHLIKHKDTINGIKFGLYHSEESKWTACFIKNGMVNLFTENRDPEPRELMVVFNERSLIRTTPVRHWEYLVLGPLEEIKRVDVFINNKHLKTYDFSTPQAIKDIEGENIIEFY